MVDRPPNAWHRHLKSGSGLTGPATSLSSLVPEYDGPGSFVKIVEDHFGERFSAGDRARNLDATGEDETQHEGVDATGDPPADSLDHGAKMGISRPNEHRSLPSLRLFRRVCRRRQKSRSRRQMGEEQGGRGKASRGYVENANRLL
jgi:hypothetical protein